jgi:MGT family glycosyltransferase
MARFLFVVPPFVGHIYPTVMVGQELMARSHEVIWVGPHDALKRLLPPAAPRIGLTLRDDSVDSERLMKRFQAVRGFANLKLMWEEVLCPLARAMFPEVVDAAQRFQPDVLISDQQTLAGALAARKLGLRWATSATTPADRVSALKWLPKVSQWIEAQLDSLQRDLGLEPVRVPEDSPYLVLSFVTKELAGPDSVFNPQYRFVGPAIGHRPDPTPFPWEQLGQLPRVLASLGTLNGERGGQFFRRLVDALGDLQVQVILVAPEGFGPYPDNFLVRTWVPQLKLLPQVNLLISHAGSNAVYEALSYGLPLVVLPITDDQPIIAQQVVEAGCGLRLSFARSKPGDIREAVYRVLTEPGFRQAASRIRTSFERAGGTARAAELLEQLATDAPGKVEIMKPFE